MVRGRLDARAGTVLFLLCPAAFLQAQTTAYDRQVHPILAARCVPCHSQEKRSGGLALGTYRDTLNGGRNGAAIRPGSSAGSLLVQRITGEVAPRMPAGGSPLSDAEIAVIRAW